MIAIGRVWGLASSAIFSDMVRGTDRNMPTGPRTHPQNTNETKTTKVERPSPCPMIFGSRMLPTKVFTTK